MKDEKARNTCSLIFCGKQSRFPLFHPLERHDHLYQIGDIKRFLFFILFSTSTFSFFRKFSTCVESYVENYENQRSNFFSFFISQVFTLKLQGVFLLCIMVVCEFLCGKPGFSQNEGRPTDDGQRNRGVCPYTHRRVRRPSLSTAHRRHRS